ncbi:MAG: outer membrane lipoprotein-sorting protein [Deltaproteobacteria bacterium]|nr:outer membrane lipoprotein-sorting protein [Deltaproteobacteria bacterium]
MKTICIIIAAATTFILFHTNAFADDPKAREIMQKVDDRDDGDNMTSQMEMILIDKHQKKRVRQMMAYEKDKGEDTLKIMFFKYPADVKNTGFLTYDYDEYGKDDDQWLYLPALRKTKRIASSDKDGSFMGSDLNYSDMTSRELEDYDFTIMKEAEVKGQKVWVIQSIPRSKDVIDEIGYKKEVLFVRQDNFYVIRAIMWTESGGYLKYMDVKILELIEGIWVGTERHVTKKKGKQFVHKTILKIDDVKFNQNLDYDMFTTRRLEKGL